MVKEFSRRYGIGLTCLLLLVFLFPLNSNAGQPTFPNPLRLEKYITRFNWQDAKNSYAENAILFIGSSSIYKWKTAEAFPNFNIINRGIPGAEISDINYFYTTLVEKYLPTTVVFYCGDNDVASGKKPLKIAAEFKNFVSKLKNQQPKASLIFLAIKPSPLRWDHWQTMTKTNGLIQKDCQDNSNCTYIDSATPLLKNGSPDKNLFNSDGLHLNTFGYQTWEGLLRPLIKSTNSK